MDGHGDRRGRGGAGGGEAVGGDRRPVHCTVRVAVRPSASILVLAICATAVVGCEMFAPDFGEVADAGIRSEEERASQRDAIVELRLDAVLPALLQRHDIDCWLLLTAAARPDPLVSLVAPSAIREAERAILLLCPDPAGEPARVAIGEGVGTLVGTYDRVHDVEDAEAAGALLGQEIRRAAPERVAWNRSPSLPLADGLAASDRAWMEELFGRRPGWEWVTSAPLVRDLLDRHLEVEVPLFAEAAARTSDVLELVLSSQVVRPGKTSLNDIRWAVRQHAADLGLDPAGPVRVHLYRPEGGPDPADPRYRENWPLPGDLILATAAIDYLGYVPRVGRWAYVSREGELGPPDEVVAGLRGLIDVLEEVGPRIRPGTSRAAAEALLIEALGGDRGVDARLTPVGAFPAEWWADDVEGGSRSGFAAPTAATDDEIRRDSFYAVELSWLLKLPGWSVPAPLRIVEAAVVTDGGLRTVVEPVVEPAFIE